MSKLIPLIIGLFFIPSVWAQGAAGGPQGDAAIMQIAVFVALFAGLYFLFIRPQNKRQKEHRNLVAALQKGDEVITNGGLLGRVTNVGDNFLTVEVAENVQIKVQRQMIQTVLPKGTYKSA